MRLVALLLAVAASAAGESFEVVHEKAWWPDGRGKVQITAEGIAFDAAEEEHSRRWTWDDIQHFDRRSAKEFVVLTYKDARWQLGRDHSYRFRITEGGIEDGLMEQIRHWMKRPATDRVVKEPQEGGRQFPVKHLHRLGGCEGELVFSDASIIYRTEHAEDAREWQVASEVGSIWSRNPYQLEIHVYENNRREFSRSRVFEFELKEPLDPALYREWKWRLWARDGRR